MEKTIKKEITAKFANKLCNPACDYFIPAHCGPYSFLCVLYGCQGLDGEYPPNRCEECIADFGEGV